MIRLRLEPPQHGWMLASLEGDAGESLLDASDVPGDSLSMLVGAACGLLEGRESAEVTWFLEPAEVTWIFHHDSVSVSDAQGRRTLGATSVTELTLTIWRALRKLESQWVAEQWSHAFPHAEVAQLGRLQPSRARRADR